LYGHKAIGHWARWLPLHYAAIPDPVAFFNFLGEHVCDEVETLAGEIAGDDPPRRRVPGQSPAPDHGPPPAEEFILGDLIYPEPRRYRHPDDDISIRVRDLLQQAAGTSSDDEQDQEL
jgi:hypothetical protein